MHGLRLIHASTLWQRLGGLLARAALREHEALVLAPCSSVHTCFMRYAIDVVFVDERGRVLKTVERLEPWRAAGCWRAKAAVELRAGQAAAHGLVPGARIDLTPPMFFSPKSQGGSTTS